MEGADWQCGDPIDNLFGTNYATAMGAEPTSFAGVVGSESLIGGPDGTLLWTRDGRSFTDVTEQIHQMIANAGFDLGNGAKPASYVENLDQFLMTGNDTVVMDNFKKGPDHWTVNSYFTYGDLSDPGIFGFGSSQGELYGSAMVGWDESAIMNIETGEVLYTDPLLGDQSPVFTIDGRTLFYSARIPDQGPRLMVIDGFDTGNRVPRDLGFDQDATSVAFIEAKDTLLKKNILVIDNKDSGKLEACVDENSAPAETTADGAVYTVNIGGDIATVTDGVPVIVDCNEPINATWVRTNEGLPVTGFATLGGEQMLVTDNHTTPDYYSTGELHSWTCDAMGALAHGASYPLIVEVGNDAGTTEFNGTIAVECPPLEGTLGDGAYAVGDEGTIEIPEGVSVEVDTDDGDTALDVEPEGNGEFVFAIKDAKDLVLRVPGQDAYVSTNEGEGALVLGVNDISTFDATGDINTTYTWTTAGNLSVTCHYTGLDGKATSYVMTSYDTCGLMEATDTGDTNTVVTGTTQDANGNRAGDTGCDHTAPFPTAPINSVIAAVMVGFMAFLRRRKAKAA